MSQRERRGLRAIQTSVLSLCPLCLCGESLVALLTQRMDTAILAHFIKLKSNAARAATHVVKGLA